MSDSGVGMEVVRCHTPTPTHPPTHTLSLPDVKFRLTGARLGFVLLLSDVAVMVYATHSLAYDVKHPLDALVRFHSDVTTEIHVTHAPHPDVKTRLTLWL